jgi:hypothetical protein
MRHTMATLLTLSSVCFASPQSAQSQCLGPDSLTIRRLPWLDSIGTSLDATHLEDRLHLRISATTSANVHLIRDSALCARVLEMARSTWRSLAGTAYVYRIGEVYAVEDPSLVPAGQAWAGVLFFSPTGEFLVAYQREPSSRRITP